MIDINRGNLLTAEADALVNTVNTVRVMGKGIAAQFKRAYPANFAAYRAACQEGRVRFGEIFVFDSGRLGPRRYVINFPTKEHWRTRSCLTDIESGMADLVRVVGDLGLASVAVPALGCGNGGLDWRDVRPVWPDLPPGCRSGADARRGSSPRRTYKRPISGCDRVGLLGVTAMV